MPESRSSRRFSHYDADGNFAYWITNDGRRIPLTDMDLGHLQNAIRFVSEQEPSPGQEKVLLALTAELDRRIASGDGAEMRIGSALFRALERK